MLRLAMTLLALTGAVEAPAAARCNDSHEVVTASLPPTIGAAIGAVGRSRARQDSATSAGTSGADASGDGLALLQGMQEADRSPFPSGSVEVAQAGRSDAAILPHARGQPAAAPQHGHPSMSSVLPTSHVTSAGRVFIEKEEEQPGVSNNLHHPSAASGVTPAPG